MSVKKTEIEKLRDKYNIIVMQLELELSKLPNHMTDECHCVRDSGTTLGCVVLGSKTYCLMCGGIIE